MVVVLSYSIKNNQKYIKLLEKLNKKYSFTLREKLITEATHIILPETYNISTAIRKMQIMNLYSLLRMIKKPILGINNGFGLMCNNITDIQKLGLGLFPIDTKTCSIRNEKDVADNIGQLKILGDTNFLNGIKIETVNCNLKSNSDVNNFTTSVISIKKKQFTLTCENENYYSLQMDTSENEKLFDKLLENFLKL